MTAMRTIGGGLIRSSGGVLVTLGGSYNPGTQLHLDSEAAGGGDGTIGTPWNSLSSITGVVAGDTVLMKRGSVFRETLTAAAGVSYGVYDSGDKPIVSGADLVTGLTQEAASTEQAGNLASINHDAGNLTAYDSVVQSGGSTAAASTEQARSGTYSMKLTGDGSDNRVYARAEASAAMTTGDTFSFFFAMYVPSTNGFGASKDMRIKLGDDNTQKFWVDLTSNASGEITSWTDVWAPGINSAFGATQSGSIANWTMDAWNTIEIRITCSATVGGIDGIYVNGELLTASPTMTYDTSALAGTNQVWPGSDTFGQFFDSSGDHVYIDDVKIADNGPISAELQSTVANRWSGALTTEPTQVFIEGVRGLRVATAAEVNASRRWHWAANVLTLYAPTDTATDPLVEASVRDYCVSIPAAADDVTVTNIHADKAAETGIDINEADDCTLDGVSVTDAFIEGIRSGILTNRVNLRIISAVVLGCGGTGIATTGPLVGFRLTDADVSACGQLHENLVGADARHTYSAGFKYWGDEVPGAVEDFVISGGSFYDMQPQFDDGTLPGQRCQGIWLDALNAPVDRPQITNVDVINCNSTGIFIEKAHDVDVTFCRVHNSGVVQYRGGIVVEANNNPPGDQLGARVINNTIVGGWWPLALNRSGSGEVADNEFINNIAYGSDDVQQLYVADGAGNDGVTSTGNVFAYNCFGVNASNFIVWDGTLYSTIAAWETASSQANNVVGDPLVVDPPDDWSLGIGSVAIDAGTAVSGIIAGGNDLGANR